MKLTVCSYKLVRSEPSNESTVLSASGSQPAVKSLANDVLRAMLNLKLRCTLQLQVRHSTQDTSYRTRESLSTA